MSDPSADRIVGLYRDKAADWIADRSRTQDRGDSLDEAAWLERFSAALPVVGTVLDVGCGSGSPIGAALIARGFRVTGVDSSPGLVDHARAASPAGEWIVGDMRALDLDRRFDGLIAWCSLFHLTVADQRKTLPRLLEHLADRAVVLFNAGSAEGEAIGEWRGEPLYHASLDPEEYRAIMTAHRFVVDATVTEPAGVWLARRAFLSAE